MMAEEISKIREKPGESNAGKYKNVKSSNFAGRMALTQSTTWPELEMRWLAHITRKTQAALKRKSIKNIQH